jgi:hypothetical protein
LRTIAGAIVKRDPKSAIVLTTALLLLVGAEVVYLENIWRRNEENRQTNDRLEALNLQAERRIAELHSAAQKIGVVFTRLNDGIERVFSSEGRLPTPSQNPKSKSHESDSRAARLLRENGFGVSSLPGARRESSVSFLVGSDHFELHRLVPLLAEEENSNAFLFVDKLDLVRPLLVPAFSMNPTSLETRFTIRVLAGPK